ncbi:MAG: hypothetical protein HY717_17355 [Planctomycetes bacterium]|nr:hypothetical protein [Planctomycetota bacterium]
MTKILRCTLIVTLAYYLLLVGCPHRTPVWSPDGRKVLLLGGADREPIDKPASKLWLVDLPEGKAKGSARPAVLKPPQGGGRLRYLAAAWLDLQSFAVLTVGWENGEPVDGSEAVWKVTENGQAWARLSGPPPSAERTPRRNPVVIPAGGGKALVYATGSETVAAVSLAEASGAKGGELFKLEQAEVVGPGPEGSFLVYRPEEGESGDLELAAIGGDQKKRWSRRFSDLRSEIAKALGKKPEEVIFNDASSSTPDPDGQTIAVTLVFTDVNWKDGVSGYLALLAAKDGALLSVSGATCLPGKPSLSRLASGGYWAWAVLPFVDKSSKNTAVGSFPIGELRGSTAESRGVRLELKDLPKTAIQGYGLSPDRQTFAVAVNGPTTRLLLYSVSGGKIEGEALEISMP